MLPGRWSLPPSAEMLRHGFVALPVHTGRSPGLEPSPTAHTAGPPGACPPVHITQLRRTVPSDSRAVQGNKWS